MYLKALAEFSQMRTHVQGFKSFFRFLHHYVLAKLATISIRVKDYRHTKVIKCNKVLPKKDPTSLLNNDKTSPSFIKRAVCLMSFLCIEILYIHA